MNVFISRQKGAIGARTLRHSCKSVAFKHPRENKEKRLIVAIDYYCKIVGVVKLAYR